MLGSVLAVALLGNLNPMRLGVILLLVSRPRTTQNLIMFWIGCMVSTLCWLMVPLMVFHFTPFLRSSVLALNDSATDGSTARVIQIGFGVLALSVAALLALRLRARSATAKSSHHNSMTSADAATVGSSDAPASQNSTLQRAVRRVIAPVRSAWEGGSLWVAGVIGLGMGPAPEMVLLVLAIIVTSGAALGAQLGAVIAYAVVLLALVETVIVSSVVATAKTEIILNRLRHWSISHRLQILVTIFTVAGASAVVSGLTRG